MNIEKNITGFTDLSDKNKPLSQYLGYNAQQHHNVYQIFYDFIYDINPSRILEIGTASGGFTRFLYGAVKELKLNCKILSYDIEERPQYKNMRKDGIDVRVENIFDDNYNDINKFVKDFIFQDGVLVVLCDGGNKINEFNLLSKFIKCGDFILAHDYCKNLNMFKEQIYGKIWNWCEITEKDIEQSCSQNNLISYNEKTFLGVAWVCKTKM